jgi:Peptidylarginine deiminase and related enzymes
MAQQLTDWTRDSNYRVGNQPLNITALPWPSPVFDDAGARLPATYANFLIINGAVLVPTYDVPQDQTALSVLAMCFPDREVIGLPCRPLVTQGGSLHCITMQIHAPCV